MPNHTENTLSIFMKQAVGNGNKKLNVEIKEHKSYSIRIVEPGRHNKSIPLYEENGYDEESKAYAKAVNFVKKLLNEYDGLELTINGKTLKDVYKT